MHNDHANLAFGWCAIQSLGEFDARTGGHLMLQQLGLVVEFPAGSTILIPSATISHGNTPIAQHERRASLVHYTAGGLFRWVEYGFRSWKTLQEEDPILAARLWWERKHVRVQTALDMFSKVEELLEDQRMIFD